MKDKNTNYNNNEREQDTYDLNKNVKIHMRKSLQIFLGVGRQAVGGEPKHHTQKEKSRYDKIS